MNFLRKLINHILLNNKICPFCSKNYSTKNILCPTCTKTITMENKQEFCRKCGKFIIKNMDVKISICQSCNENEQYFDIARGVGLYQGIIKDNIYKFKYHGQRSLAEVMARLMVDKAIAYSEYSKLDCIVPVPIAEEKLMVRKYNQAYLLSREVGKLMKLPLIADKLIRVVNTPAQSKLSKEAREENLKGAFKVVEAEVFYNKKILLVDDILTTGSTANECSRIMKEKGAESVAVLTLVTGKTF